MAASPAELMTAITLLGKAEFLVVREFFNNDSESRDDHIRPIISSKFFSATNVL